MTSGLLARLLEGGHSRIAGRLAGAFRNGGRDRLADEIVKTMAAADYDIRESDPFEDRRRWLCHHAKLPLFANRIRLLWDRMREAIIAALSDRTGISAGYQSYLKGVEEAYVADAYHSLSIEGYRVSLELIERVRSGNWNPEVHEHDREQTNAMAARGYWQSFQVVKKSVGRVMGGENPGTVARRIIASGTGRCSPQVSPPAS